MHALNIVHVVRQFHPGVGGVETVVFELAQAQLAAGHKVCIVTLNRLFKETEREALAERDSVNGIEIIRIPFFGSSRYPIAPSVITFIRRAEIIHVHCIDFFFDFLAWTKPLHRKKLIISTHGGFFHTTYAAGLKRLYFKTITRLSLTWYDAVAAVSVSDYELFARLRPRGLVCIENGVNLAKYADAASRESVKTMVWIGRFSTNKRLDRLLAFFAELRRLDPDWSLRVIGRPWDLDISEITSLAQRAGLLAALEIVQAPSDTDLRRLLHGCAVLVSCSDFEGFGLVAVEGLSAGLFPVLSDIPPFRRLVERTGVGMLADFSRPKAAAVEFSERWNELSRDYRRLRQASIAAADQFDWQHASNAYMELYEAVLGTRRRRILDLSVAVWTRSDVVGHLDRHFQEKTGTIVAFANANSLNIAYADERLRIALREALVLNDGIGVDLASKILFGARFPENINGTDFTPYYLQSTRHQFRIYLLGGRPGVAERAAPFLSRMCPRHQIVGCRDGYFPPSEDMSVAGAIRASEADVVLVAMGNPEQELWLRNNLAATGCRLGFAVGALLDFLSGEARRAPAWVRAARVEWAYRLAREPRRLWRRYVLGNPIFVLRVLVQWWSGARV